MSRRLNQIFIILILVFLMGIGILFGVSAQARGRYGPPSSALNTRSQFEYAARLLLYGDRPIQPLDSNGMDQQFNITAGEVVPSIAVRLEENGLIRDAVVFRDYLIYTGLDRGIQAGEHTLSPAQSIVDIAHAIQDATPGDITFVILPGWRMEEIAASLPTSGLVIPPDDFLRAARSTTLDPDFKPASSSAEGFLYPDTYILSRETTVNALLDHILRNFSLHLTSELRAGFSSHGLSVYQAVTLASIIQREAVIPEEGAQIASVFINRLNIGMKLETDPTVQYALGYNQGQGTWWTNPLSLEDLDFDSPYNTYIYAGLPPGPISNPSLSALLAVAFPAETPFYYFRARCDGSGLHNFAMTFEEHVANGCQ